MSRLAGRSDPVVPAPRRPTSASGAPGDAPPDEDDVVVTVRVLGSLDVLSAPGWAAALIRAVEAVADTAGADGRTDPGHVVCDLGAVSLLAAAGVTALLEVDAHARSRRVRFSVARPSRPAERVLDVTGTRFLTRHDASSDEAMSDRDRPPPCRDRARSPG